MYIYSLTYEGILHMNRHLTYPVHQVPAPAEVPVPRRRIARAGRPMMARAMPGNIPGGSGKKTQWLLDLTLPMKYL
jgi:hypothetical protein